MQRQQSLDNPNVMRALIASLQSENKNLRSRVYSLETELYEEKWKNSTDEGAGDR